MLTEELADGLMRFQEERMSVSGTSRESYRSWREETVGGGWEVGGRGSQCAEH